MLASDDGSVEVVHVLIISVMTIGTKELDLIRVPARTRRRVCYSDYKSLITLSVHSNGTACFVFHIACRTTASFRATPTRALLKSTVMASLSPPALSVENDVVLVSSVVAAS